jgi:hypothetical protein
MEMKRHRGNLFANIPHLFFLLVNHF